MLHQSSSRIVLLGTLFLWSTSGTSASALSPADNCEADKLKRAALYSACRLKAESKAIKKAEAPDYTKCDSKFGEKWTAAETRAGGQCPTNGDLVPMQTRITGDANDIVACLNGACPTLQAFPATGQTTAYGSGSDGDVQVGATLSYTDNGDGTVTDNNTGLMWEKKDDSGGIHDKDNTYTWCGASCGLTNEMDGTITTTFLATLNGGGGFAGYTDWRIPNYKELQSIVDYGTSSPSIDPAFHQSATCNGCTDVTLTSCSCTTLSFYLSSTTVAFSPINAWTVFFFDSTVNSNVSSKTVDLHARAVRGGL